MNHPGRNRAAKFFSVFTLLQAIAGAGVCDLAAQNQLNEHVAVDGRYLPEVTKADRLRSPLVPLEMKFGSDPAEGALTGEPADFAPSLMAMPPTVWRGVREPWPKGYVDLTLGSWLDGRLLVGYRAIDNEETGLNFRFDGFSTLLYRPEDALYRRRRLDGTAGVDFRKRFSGAGTLDATVQYRLGRFNYDLLRRHESDRLNPDYAEEPSSPFQTVNEGALNIGWRSDRERSVRWYSGLNGRLFSYRTVPFTDRSGTRETTLSLEGGLEGDAGIGSAAGDWRLDGRASLNMYGGDVHPTTNGLITLTPSWNISRPHESAGSGGAGSGDFRWEARIGAELDFSFNQRAGEERFGFLHVAPDASVSVANSLIGAYFRATGGVEEQTAASLNALDPYAVPEMTGSLPAYTPADLRLGVTLTPGGGFSATVEGSWSETRSIYAGGLWTLILQDLSRMNDTEGAVPASTYYNLHGYSVRAAAAWKAWKYLEVEADATWQPQKKSTGRFNGYDRPVWTASVGLKSNPWKELTLKAGWRLRAKRAVTVSDGLSYGDAIRLPNISDLSFGVSYKFTPRFSAGARITNLLDRKTELLPGMVSEGFVATGGIQILF